jgi:hypothetical protein
VTVGDVVSFPTPLEDNFELVSDFARYCEGILDEKFIRKKYRFDNSVWENLGENDAFVEAVEAEKIRRVRDGSAKRELAQKHIVRGPTVLGNIMDDANASPRHRVDAIKTLDTLAANGPEAAPTADSRFIIQINLGEDILRFNKSIAVCADDIDPENTDTMPQDAAATITKKDDDSE